MLSDGHAVSQLCPDETSNEDLDLLFYMSRCRARQSNTASLQPKKASYKVKAESTEALKKQRSESNS